MCGVELYNEHADKPTRSCNSDLNLRINWGNGDWSFKDIASILMDFDVEMLLFCEVTRNYFMKTKGIVCNNHSIVFF
jgi:hypothetical protein